MQIIKQCQRVLSYNKKLCKFKKCHSLERQLEGFKIQLSEFFTLLMSLQEDTKAQDFVKHSANGFANGRNHI